MRHFLVAVSGEWVLQPHEQPDLRLLCNGRPADIGRICRLRGHQTDLGTAQLDDVDHVFVFGDQAFEFKIGVALLECGQRLLVAIGLVGVRHDERQTRLQTAGHLGGHAVHLRAGVEHAAHLSEHRVARFGQGGLARAAVEQCQTEVDFKIGDRLADRGLPLAQFSGRGGKGTQRSGFGKRQ